MESKRSDSDSKAQRDAEAYLIEALQKKLGFKPCDNKRNIGGCTLIFDGYFEDEKQIILVEVWAHIGRAKSAQKHKVLADVLKLTFARKCIENNENRQIRCIYVFADDEASQVLTNHRSWTAAASNVFKIESVVFELPSDIKMAVIEAQKRQDLRNRENITVLKADS